MKRRFQRLLASILTTLMLLSHSLAISQDASILVLESEFQRVDSVLIKLEKRRNELSSRAQSFAEEIEELKKDKDLSFFERQRLNRLLKDSQHISNGIESIDSELNKSVKKHAQIGEKLLQLYDQAIKTALTRLESHDLETGTRQQVLVNLEMWRGKKEDVQEKIKSDGEEVKISAVTIDPDDSPKQIERKADLLKDQEDKLLALAGQLNKKTKEVARELAVKERMSDFVSDIALFDQQEETLGNLNPERSGSRSFNSPDAAEEGDFGTVDHGTGSREPELHFLVGQKEFDFAQLSPEQLEEAIEQLRRTQRRIRAQADSLGQQATRFYRTAKEMKKQ